MREPQVKVGCAFSKWRPDRWIGRRSNGFWWVPRCTPRNMNSPFLLLLAKLTTTSTSVVQFPYFLKMCTFVCGITKVNCSLTRLYNKLDMGDIASNLLSRCQHPECITELQSKRSHEGIKLLTPSSRCAKELLQQEIQLLTPCLLAVLNQFGSHSNHLVYIDDEKFNHCAVRSMQSNITV